MSGMLLPVWSVWVQKIPALNLDSIPVVVKWREASCIVRSAPITTLWVEYTEYLAFLCSTSLNCTEWRWKAAITPPWPDLQHDAQQLTAPYIIRSNVCADLWKSSQYERKKLAQSPTIIRDTVWHFHSFHSEHGRKQVAPKCRFESRLINCQPWTLILYLWQISAAGRGAPDCSQLGRVHLHCEGGSKPSSMLILHFVLPHQWKIRFSDRELDSIATSHVLIIISDMNYMDFFCDLFRHR